MAKFTLLVGSHVKSVGEGSFYGVGDVVESSLDLVKAFGADKFAYVVEAKPVVEDDARSDSEKLEDKTIAELTKLAKAAGVDIPEGTKKAEVLKLTQAALEAAGSK